jgi:hypothetical protein
MADFVVRQQQFAAPEWSDKTKRDRTIQALINALSTTISVLALFLSGITAWL